MKCSTLRSTEMNLKTLKGIDLNLSPRELTALTREHQRSVLEAASGLPTLIDVFQDLVRDKLLRRMSEMSVAYMDSVWKDQLEYLLWDAIKHGPEVASAAEVHELERLAEWAGGWYHFPHEAKTPEFIEAEEWEVRYTKYVEYQNQLRRSTAR